jgi:cytochrome c oxidase subunit III
MSSSTVTKNRFHAFQFDTLAEQQATAKLGMWLFLASEILFFGGLFAAYGVYRGNHPEVFLYGQHFLDWRLGAVNTLVLITSSLTAAWAVRSAQLGDRRGLLANLAITLLMASVFMVVKYTEYSHKLQHGIVWGPAFSPSAEAIPEVLRGLPVPTNIGTFFTLYFVMTGLHGIHVLVGMGLYGWLLVRARRGDFGPEYYGPVDVVALYWHLVDMIWIFLFPLLYLIG